MKKNFLHICILFFFIFQSCATLFSGNTEEIMLSSEPSKVNVLLNGHNMGTTPTVLILKKGKDYIIEFAKEGFISKSLNMTYSVGAGWIILDILSGLIGIIIDAATGNWNEYDYTNYQVHLEKVQ